MRLLTLALVCLVASPAALALDFTLLSTIAAKIRVIVNQSNQPKNDALLHTAYARLAFHDCTGPGGCDGCINLNLGENNGLGGPIAVLEGFYNGTYMRLSRSNVSRADMWAIAALVSLQYGIAIDGPGSYTPPSLKLEAFKWGRKDCPTSPQAPTETSQDFPMGIVGHQATVNFFQQRFGFNAKQTLALMGVHSLGNAKRRNSGFAGAWSHKREALSNRYYSHLTDFSWTQLAINQNVSGGPKVQWTHPGFLSGVCMLNSDMALYKEIPVDKEGFVPGACGKRLSACDKAPTWADFNRYARNNTRWINDFADVYNLMTSNCGRGNGVVYQCKTAVVSKTIKKAGMRDYAQRFTASEVFAKSVSMPWRTVQA